MMRRVLLLFLVVALAPAVFADGPNVTNIVHLAPSIVNKSDTGVALLTFTLTTSEPFPSGRWSGSGAFSATTYTGVPTDLSRVALYADDGDATFDAGDTLCGSASTAYQGAFSFKPALACNLAQNTATQFFVVVDISATAVTGNAVDLRIEVNDMIFTGGNSPSTAINPSGQAYVEQIVPDTTNPVTTHNAPSGWQSSSVTVQLTCTDTQSGCARINYILNGNLDNIVGNTGTVTIQAEGNNTLEFWSVDNAGNEEDDQSINVAIDTTSPELVSSTVTTIGKENDTITFSAEFNDALNGMNEEDVAGIEHTVSPMITWENLPALCDGTFTQTSYTNNIWTGTVTVPANCDGTASVIVADVQDAAGNRIVQVNPANFTIDNTPPPVPTLINLQNNELTNQENITFNWTSVMDDVVNFRFQLATDNTFTNIIEDENTTNLNFNATNLVDDEYYWRVSSVDAVGHISYSETRIFTKSSEFLEVFAIPLTVGETTTNGTDGISVNINVTQNETLFIARVADTPGVPAGVTSDWGDEYDFAITDPASIVWPVEFRMAYNNSLIGSLQSNSLRIGWYDNNWTLFPSGDSGINSLEGFVWTESQALIHIGAFGTVPTSNPQPTTSLTKSGRSRSSSTSTSSTATTSTSTQASSSELQTENAPKVENQPIKKKAEKPVTHAELAPKKVQEAESNLGDILATAAVIVGLAGIATAGIMLRNRHRRKRHPPHLHDLWERIERFK